MDTFKKSKKSLSISFTDSIRLRPAPVLSLTVPDITFRRDARAADDPKGEMEGASVVVRVGAGLPAEYVENRKKREEQRRKKAEVRARKEAEARKADLAAR